MQNGKPSRKLVIDEASEPRLQQAHHPWIRGQEYGFRADSIDGFTWSEGMLTLCFCGSFTLSVPDPDRAALEYLKDLIKEMVVHETV